MQRAYDQVIHDVALQKLNVVMCLDRAGVVGNDGPTHQGTFDLAYFRCIPNLIISAPMNESELRNLMYTAQKGHGPFVIRYPKGRCTSSNWKTPLSEIPVGKGRIIQNGEQFAFLSIGHIGNTITTALSKLNNKGIKPAHFDMRFLKPIDEELLKKAASNYPILITVEDGSKIGGLGSAVSEFLTSNNFSNKLITLGFPDEFIEHGNTQQLFNKHQLNSDGIANQLINAIEHIQLT